MTLEDFEVIISHLTDLVDAIVLSGGEPTLSSDFISILRLSLSSFRKVCVTTNGTVDVTSKLSILSPIERQKLSIQISIDGVALKHDEIRGTGTYKKIVQHIRNLNVLGIKPVISTTVSKRNIGYVLELGDELGKFDIKGWTIVNATPLGNEQLAFCLSIDEWNRFCDEVRNLKCTFPIHVNKMFDFKCLDQLSDADVKKAADLHIENHLRNCSSGTGKLYVYPDGNVYACTCLKSLPMGNLYDQTLEEVVRSPVAQLLCGYKLVENSPCRQCRYVELCNGGCLGMSLKEFGRIGVGDVRCPRFQDLSSR